MNEQQEQAEELKAKRNRLIGNLKKTDDPTIQYNIKLRIDDLEYRIWKLSKTTTKT